MTDIPKFNYLFLRITVALVLIGLPALTASSIWGPYGILAHHRTYLNDKAETLSKNQKPCIVCGLPGQRRTYRKVGTGVSNPFKYRGPYIYCSRHANPTPALPYKLGGEIVKKVLNFVIVYAVIILMTSVNLWKRTITEEEAKESWEMLGLFLFLFFIFFLF